MTSIRNIWARRLSGSAPRRWATAVAAALLALPILLAAPADRALAQPSGSEEGVGPDWIPPVLRQPRRFGEGCSFQYTPIWTTDGDDRYFASAFSRGRSCDALSLTIELRAQSGRLLWREEFDDARTVRGFNLRRPPEPRQMRGLLIDWVTNYGSIARGSRALPTWELDANAPGRIGGIAFEVADGVDENFYRGVRAANRPLFCYMNSIASMRCLVLEDGGRNVTEIGVQPFALPR